MSKIFSLIKNEWKKQYKKISVKVMFLIVVVVSIAAPFLLKHFSNQNNSKYAIENYKNEISWNETEIAQIDSKNKNAEINKKIIQAQIDMNNIKIEEKISWDDWRSEVTYNAVQKKKLGILLTGIQEGLSENELMTNIYDFDANEIKTYYEMSKDELSKAIKKNEDEAENLYSMIKENDYMVYLQNQIKQIQLQIDDQKEQLKELGKDNSEEAKQQIEDVKKTIAEQEEIQVIIKYMYDNNITYDRNDWRYNTTNDLQQSIPIKGEALMDEAGFKNQYAYEISQNGYTYDQYKKDREARIEEAENDIKLDWYSLENNTPQVKFSSDARASLKSTYLFYVNMAIIFVIIIAGGIVSSEYSTGTIRLLMIRPVSRWKILFAKIFSAVSMGYTVIFSGFILNIISSGIANGFSAYSIPKILVENGNIVQHNYLLSLVPNLLFSSISLLFIASIAFAISTVVKNTAIAVGLTMMGFLGAMPATIVAVQLKMKWIQHTFVPYVNLTSYVDGGSSMVQQIRHMGLNLTSQAGVMHLLLITVIMIVLSFVVFIKRDVKN